ncbi:coiled-coil alpha-helical rod protein 1-like [Mytilus galloprovincialis]|uniref:coiled-coil alpha-helical rod protein 1-like n=1 Tax=Mytilus galloprovincialis TaxID=29158 RepID=UPI003F7BA12D
MAENLNTPSHFLSVKPPVPIIMTGQKEKIDLLPPSAFQDIGKDDAWKELARATTDVMNLKLENQKLRDEQNKPIFVPTPVAKSPREECRYNAKEDRKYIDELITKQASEIAELRNEIRQLKCVHKEEITEIERQTTASERKNIQTIAILEADLKSREDRYDSQVDRLSSEHQREVETLYNQIRTLEDQLSSVSTRSKDRIRQLESELEKEREEALENASRLQLEIKTLTNNIENQNKQIMQLKNYIGDTEKGPKPAEVWRKEKETLENKLEILEVDKENIQSNLQLLNIRFSSLNEILRTQEAEVSRVSQDKSDKNKQESLLLTRWREKVFALMVQQKSAAIIKHKDEQNWKGKVGDLESRLVSANNQMNVLSHAMSDKQAQLDMEVNNNKKLQHEVIQAQQMALLLDDRLTENRQSAEQLQQFCKSVCGKLEESYSVLNTVFSTMKTFGQRISFASGRVEMLQGLFARKKAMSQVHREDKTEPLLQLTDIQDDSSILRRELERVTEERDRVVAQLKQDSETWTERHTAATVQKDEEIKNLRETIEELEMDLQGKSQQCNKLTEEVDRFNIELEDANEQIDNLKIELGKCQVTSDQVIAEQKTIIEQEFAEQLADLDRQLNDAKREHTKAVVSLRQLERQTTREKERATEHLNTVEQHYTRQIEGLQQKLQTVESERNLMMATLRQEGLIGRVKNARGEPVQFDESAESQEPEISLPRKPELSPPVKDEPITSVLEDLKSLTSAVLKDDLSSSDEDEED